MMLILDPAQTARALEWNALVDALEKMFRRACEMPVRHHHDISVPGEQDATLLLMPAWISGAYIGVKMVNVFPDNNRRGLPAISGNYILASGATGEMLAIIDGDELTARRTAAASALASSYLSRRESRRLLIVGSGRLSAYLAQAHASQRPIEEIEIWGRTASRAVEVVERLQARGYRASVCEDLATGCQWADIISCATLAQTPLIKGDWLAPGTHLDLVGGFRSNMREADDEVVKHARVFVDTRAGCLDAGDFCPGDICDPVKKGLLDPEAIRDLYALCRGEKTVNRNPADITMFKSVGAALEDLAGAILAYESGRK